MGAQKAQGRELEKRLAGDFLAAVEASQLVKLPTAASTETAGALFGITDEVYARSVLAAYSERKEMMVQGLLPKIEGRLRDKCDRMVAFAQPEEEENFVCGLGTSVTQTLEGQLAGLRADRESLAEGDEAMRALEQHHVKLLGEYLSELEAYLTQARLQKQYNWDRTNAQHLLMQVSTLQLQLQELEARLVAETYTPAHVAALTKIKDRLVVKQTELQLQCDELTVQLRRFQGAGPDFRRVVDEYVAVEEEACRMAADIEVLRGGAERVSGAA